ncbi:hypothetical protein BGX27_011175 [Mortierella sp. AM989]|nr:hypothetical protein BGX27_011175 [Mortierella sp. AM989]
MQQQQQVFNAENYPIVMAIDFGPTHSPGPNIQYPKVPTLNLYKKDDPEHKLVAWGWKAKMEALKPTARHHTLLSPYMLHLGENPLEIDITVLKAISDYLAAFHEYVVREAMRESAKNFQKDHFRYCLTVPAMWSDKAKNLMRLAAIKAQLIEETDHPDRLMVISESEAAALYCERKCDMFDLAHGDRFLICNAGERTVDLMVFEVAVTSTGRRLSEVTKGHRAS